MADIVTHETQSAEPGEFVKYLADKAPKPALATVTPEPAAPAAAPADPDPAPAAKTDGWEDPETHEVIEKPGRAEKRIKRLWTEREQERERAAKLERELAELRAAQIAPGKTAAAPAADGAASTPPAAADELTAAAQARIRSKPNRADIGTTYPTYEDYVEDCAIWGGELAAEKRALLAEQQQATTRQTQQQQDFAADVAEARKEYGDDFDEVINADLPINQAIWDATINAPKGLKGHVLAYLGLHPDETRRIASLEPGPALVAMGEVIATVKAARAAKAPDTPAPESKPRSRAPAPLMPATRNNGAPPSQPSQIADAGGDPVAYIKMRNEQTRRRL